MAAMTNMAMLLSVSLIFWLLVNLFTFGFILLFCRANDYHPDKVIATAASESSRHLKTVVKTPKHVSTTNSSV